MSPKDRWLDQDWSETYENGQWHRDGGNFHSLQWMVAVCNILMQSPVVAPIISRSAKWSIDSGRFVFNPIKIHDYGCGEGDGTTYLQTIFPFARITGFDFWPKAVELARDRWTDHNIIWKEGDVADPQEHCDFSFSIQTTDHVEDTAACINAHLPLCKLHIIAWAVLPSQPEHPSQDQAWLADVPAPALNTSLYMPRVAWESNKVVPDRIQILVWNGTHDSTRSAQLAEKSTGSPTG